MRTIPFFRASTPLTPAERLAKRHLVFKDTLALLSVFAVTCVLAVLTWLIFRSYSQHQSDAAARWKLSILPSRCIDHRAVSRSTIA